MTPVATLLSLVQLLSLVLYAAGTGYYPYKTKYGTYKDKYNYPDSYGGCTKSYCQKSHQPYEPYQPYKKQPYEPYQPYKKQPYEPYQPYKKQPYVQCPSGYKLQDDNTCGCPAGYGSHIKPGKQGYPSQAPSCRGLSPSQVKLWGRRTNHRNIYSGGQNGCGCFRCPQGYKCGGGPIHQAAFTPDQPQLQYCRGKPPRRANAKPWGIKCKNLPHGRACTTTCGAGCRPVGGSPMQAHCQSDGSWKVTGSCQVIPKPVITCPGSPDPAANTDGWQASCVDGNLGVDCVAQCADGYTGSVTARCTKQGWTQTGSCEANQAGCQGSPSTGTNANPFPASCSDGDEGTQCTATCIDNYSGTATAVCTNSDWVVTSTCTQDNSNNSTGCVDAPTDGTNAIPFESCTDRQVTDSCTAGCAIGFNGTGALAVCTEAGWDVNSDCTPVSTACVDSPPPGDNSEAFANCSNKALGEQCTAACVQGATGTEATAFCTDAGWDVSSDCVIDDGSGGPLLSTGVKCSGPLPTDSGVDWTDAGGVCTNADVLQICVGSCAAGLNGTISEATCTSDGTWSVMSDCA